MIITHINKDQFTYKVGNVINGSKIVDIEEFEPRGEGDRWRWVVKLEDGGEVLVFNADEVYKKAREQE